jgi:hypothetical protein
MFTKYAHRTATANNPLSGSTTLQSQAAIGV